MAASDITLSSATRSNLLSLQKTTDLIGRTQDRLSTGKKVNSAIDDALSFFTARGLSDRATDLTTIKSGIENGISVLTQTTDALSSVEDVLKQMKAVASSARSTAATDTATRETLAKQYETLRSQIDTIVADSSFNGVNLLNPNSTGAPETLTVKFSEQDKDDDDERRLEIVGKNTTSSGVGTYEGLGVDSVAANAWSDVDGSAVTKIDMEITKIDSALKTVRSRAQEFGVNASMLQIRNEFTSNLVKTLQSGAADLVNADLNEESANMLSLQTRQQLGSIALSIAQQSEQSILRLF